MSKFRALWLGDIPLSEAFWTWAVLVGLLINIASSVVFLALIMHDQLLAALLIGKAVSLPYNLAALVGVWRSAARYNGPAVHAELARVTTVVLMMVLSLT